MKLKISLALVIIQLGCLCHSLAQSQNQVSGTIVEWGQQVMPYVEPGTSFKAVASCWYQNLALKQDGTVVGWGANAYGALNIPTNLTGVIAIALGCAHGLALKSGGTVTAWGTSDPYNQSYGQTNVPQGLTGIVAIAAGGWHSLALKSDGTVVSWGYNSYGQTNVPPGLSNVVAVAAGWDHSEALKSDGTVVAWGAGLTNNPSDGVDYGQSLVPSGLSNVVAIAAARWHSLALKSDGTVVSWGDVSHIQTNAPPGLSNVMTIAAGDFHNLAIKKDGTVVAWGYNGWGPCAVPGGLSNVVQVAGGWGHSVALKNDGTLIAWGDDSRGQSIVPMSLCNIVAATSGIYDNLALKSDGTVMAWGFNAWGETSVPTGLNGVVAIAAGANHSMALKSDGTVVAWGAGLTNDPSDGYDYGQSIVPAGLSSVVAIAAGGWHSLALKSDGTVVSWGYNSYGQTNVPPGLSNVVAVAAGWDHSEALKSDGTVVAWGDNYYGESRVPTGLNGVVAIAAGDDHCLALKSDGTVVAWGDNYYSESRVPTGLNGVMAIAAGGEFSLALVASANQSPTILLQPYGLTAQDGNNVTFNVMASGNSPLTFQWQFNGLNLAGQTAASLSLTNIQFASAGGYSVVVTNAYGSATSAVAQLTVFTNLVVAQTNRTPTTNEIGQPAIPTSNYFKVFTNGNFYSGIALNPNKNTIVLTHGWNGKPGDWAAYTAQIIQQRIGINTANIVAWDWSGDAQSDFFHLGVIAAKTPREGNALGTNLVAALGANYSQRIHFIGHSLGTLVNAAAANYIHTNGFSWTNTQMTLCDEAEVAWTFTSAGWQMATTLPEIVGQAGSTLATFDGNFSTPQPGWANPLPNQFAWADNYVSAFGMLHSNAANVILTQNFPVSLPDVGTVAQEFYNFHDYAHFFYEDTIEPGFFNTGGAINATYAGFICSFEGGGYAGRPGTNTYFYQDPNGLELSLVQTDLGIATNLLNARFKIYQSIGVSSAVSQEENGVFGAVLQTVGQVNGQIESAGQNLENMVLNFLTRISGGSLVKSAGAQPLSGPVPLGGGTGNTPAYAWVPLNVPSNALSMSFDFMLQGNGNNDSFQVALNGTNVMSLETSLIQTNVTLNSGMIDVSPYAGRQVTLFMGIVGGTSTNAALTASDFQFYVALPPSLQIQLAGTNVVVTWPLSAAGYVLQSASKLAPPVSWTTVTNVPVIVNFQYTVTNQISRGSRFYRLAIIAAPALQAQVSGKNFILSWPTNATGYVLQTTTNLAAANSWTAVTNTPATVYQQSVVTNQISGAARFYRLKQQ